MRSKALMVGAAMVVAVLGCRSSEATDTVLRAEGATLGVAEPPQEPRREVVGGADESAGAPSAPKVGAEVARGDYPWLADAEAPMPELTPLSARFAPPEGYRRVEVEAGSYGAWLRGLPVWLDRTRVLAYDGRELGSPSAAVVYLDVGDRDLQQCADSAIRLHAEYRWHRGEKDRISYHFTSGDVSSWKGWRGGERFVIAGNTVKRVGGPGRRNDHATFREYLAHLFRYAGTQSLRLDSDPVKPGNPLMAGDFFVTPGAPGHAIVVLDVAENGAGERVALMGQGYMPAQDFHVLRDQGEHVVDGVWFKLSDAADAELQNPSWSPFPRTSARRFR